MSDSWRTTADPAVVMREIQEAIRAKRGVDGERDGTPEVGPAVFRGVKGASSRLRECLGQAAARQIVQELPFRSSVPLVGGLIARFRAAWNAVSTKWYVRYAMQQQEAFNGAVVGALQELSTALESLERRIEEQCVAPLAGLGQSVEAARQRDESLSTELATVAQELRATCRDLERYQRGVLAQLVRRAPSSPALDSAAPPHRNGQRDAGDGAVEFDWLAFNERFAGPDEAIASHFQQYLEFFAGRGRVLDLGCGRGVFLDLLEEVGARGYGVDLAPEMVSICLGRGFEAHQEEAIEHLRGLADASLDGVFMAHLVEHFAPRDALEVFRQVFRVLRPGAYFVLETPNVTSPFVALQVYNRDPSHRQPLHPETYQFMLEQAGFVEPGLRYSSPLPSTLDPVSPAEGEGPLAHVCRDNFARLHAMLVGSLNVAMIARR